MPLQEARPGWTMMRHFLLATALLAMLLPMALAQTPPAQSVTYELKMVCPGVGLVTRCPVEAIDEMDAMGDPALAVDPDNPRNMILASLHGSGDSNGPSAKSRSGQAFTTFTTQSSGASWTDRPFTPPSAVGSGAYGEHPAITIDPYGRVFIGSLYAVPFTNQDRGPDGRYDYVIAAQKFRNLDDINRNQQGQGDYNAEYIGSVYPGNAIRQMWFVYNRVTDNMTMLWTEQVTKVSSPAQGGQTSHVSGRLDDVLRRDPSAGLLAPTLRQAQQGDAPRSVIGVVWTDSSTRGAYGVQPRAETIGPCSTSTNPVIKDNWLYVGCKMADEGVFPYNPAAVPDSLHMFRMHPDGGTPQYLGEAPLAGGKPKLGVRSDGRIALMTIDVEEGEMRLQGVYGKDVNGRMQWGRTHAYGSKIDPLPRSVELVDANIQDMIYREYSGVVHMILKQVVQPKDGAADRVAGAIVPTIRKSIVAVDEEYSVLGQLHLDLGNPLNRSRDNTLLAQSDAVFNDLSDDFLELPSAPYEHNGRPLGDMYQREFFAVADYGIVLFAEILEITDLRGPAFGPSPAPPPPPVPAPAPAPIPAMVPAGVLSASALLAGSAATIKRKAVVRAGRKRRL